VSGILRPETLETLWQPTSDRGRKESPYYYALGWLVSSPEERDKGKYIVQHTGNLVEFFL